MSLRVIVADDHQVIRVGLRAALERHADIAVVAEADSASGALACILAERPDVAILDVYLPDESGLAIVPAIRSGSPHTRVLVLSIGAEPGIVRSALAAGVHGYVNKSAELDEVVRAVRALAQGRSWLSIPLDHSSLAMLVQSEPSILPSPPRFSTLRPLSGREREILTLFAEGLTQREIAARLGVRMKTVETYRSRLGNKFGASTREQLVSCARELGVLDEIRAVEVEAEPEAG